MLIVLEKQQRTFDVHFCNILRIFVLFFYTNYIFFMLNEDEIDLIYILIFIDLYIVSYLYIDFQNILQVLFYNS